MDSALAAGLSADPQLAAAVRELLVLLARPAEKAACAAGRGGAPLLRPRLPTGGAAERY